MSDKKFTFVDPVNGIRIEESDHTVKLSVKESVHLTPVEAEAVIQALTKASGRVRLVQATRPLGITIPLIGFLAIGLIAAAVPAYAQGRCMEVRDYDRRQACIAAQDGNSAECNGLRDQSDRALCRIRAENRRGLRDPYSAPLGYLRPLGGNH